LETNLLTDSQMENIHGGNFIFDFVVLFFGGGVTVEAPENNWGSYGSCWGDYLR